MKKITSKELYDLCKEKDLITRDSTEYEFFVEGPDYHDKEYTRQIIAVVEALGIEVVESKDES